MQMEELKQSASGLEFKLHPLVLINVSDHFTRLKANASDGDSPPVLGCLLGSHTGLTVEVSNSFELQCTIVDGAVSHDREFLATRQDQYKKVFPKLDVVGWYTIGASLEDMHIAVHKQMMEINESPVLLMLNPQIDRMAKDLPVTLYESEVHVIDGSASLRFVVAKYSIETSDAERIAVDQVTKITPAGNGSTSELTTHMTSLHSAMKMLITRIKVLMTLLQKMKAGEIPYDHSLVRQITGIVRRLPAVQTKEFQEDFLMEYNDSLLVVYLTSITKGVATLNDLMDKFQLAYDKGGRGRRGSGIMA